MVLVLSNWQVNIHEIKISVLSKVSVAGATLVWQVCIHECTKIVLVSVVGAYILGRSTYTFLSQ